MFMDDNKTMREDGKTLSTWVDFAACMADNLLTTTDQRFIANG